jgi:hypothetical protein
MEAVQNVELVGTTGGSYYVSEYTSGSAYGYVLRRGNEYVSCDEVLIMETDEEELEYTFEDWKEAAEAGEEGYAYWVEAE